VIKWIIDRVNGQAPAVKTPIGWLPTPKELQADDLDISKEGWETLLGVDPPAWVEAAQRQAEFFERFGDRMPPKLLAEGRDLLSRLKSA
jgi:phosphoenolpyruvate carboxykinase (GTP)